MNDTIDDVRLRAEEAQMRHALGLDGETQVPRPQEQPNQASGPSHDRLSLHRPPRRFVKDGEVPVTMVRRTHPTETMPNVAPTASNQLEAARQTIRSQAVATERAERSLNEAQATIRDLRTKLAHERMAKDEAFAALRRVEAERDAALTAAQASRMELATERVGREKIELELRKALDARQAAEDRQLIPRRPRGRPPKVLVETFGPIEPPRKRGRPRKIVAEGLEPIAAPKKRGRPPKVRVESMAPPRPRGRPRKVIPDEQAELGLVAENTPRRVGRPPKVREPKPVKWWTSGWKAKSL
jgi:AT hook motif